MKITDNDEFEIMFNNYKSDNKLSIIKFKDALKYLKWKSDSENKVILSTTTLDIGYGYENNSTYRVTITGLENINKILNLVHQRKNHIIFSILVSQFHSDPNFTFINKVKDMKNIIDVDQFDIRFRKSIEEPISEAKMKELSTIPISNSDKIFFRFK